MKKKKPLRVVFLGTSAVQRQSINRLPRYTLLPPLRKKTNNARSIGAHHGANFSLSTRRHRSTRIIRSLKGHTTTSHYVFIHTHTPCRMSAGRIYVTEYDLSRINDVDKGVKIK